MDGLKNVGLISERGYLFLIVISFSPRKSIWKVLSFLDIKKKLTNTRDEDGRMLPAARDFGYIFLWPLSCVETDCRASWMIEGLYSTITVAIR